MTEHVSPFSFLDWVDDECAFVAGTPDSELGYIALLQVDGIQGDAIRDYAVSVKGEAHWKDDLARDFPSYVAALAREAQTPCFVTTGSCNVEYADINTGEVHETTLPATASAYNEAVRVGEMRAAHKREGGMGGGAKGVDDDDKGGKATAQRRRAHGKKHGDTTQRAHDDNDDNDDDDEYEDVTDEEDDEERDDDDETNVACMAKRHLMEMLGTQFEAAISLAHELGLTSSEVHDAFAAVTTHAPVPSTAEECMQAADGDKALQQYLHNLTKQSAGRCQQQ